MLSIYKERSFPRSGNERYAFRSFAVIGRFFSLTLSPYTLEPSRIIELHLYSINLLLLWKEEKKLKLDVIQIFFWM